jgi:hypothetical protein
MLKKIKKGLMIALRFIVSPVVFPILLIIVSVNKNKFLKPVKPYIVIGYPRKIDAAGKILRDKLFKKLNSIEEDKDKSKEW